MEDCNSVGSIMRQNMTPGELLIPIQKMTFCLDGAEIAIKKALSYFVKLEGRELEWLPEYEKVAEWLTNTQGRGLFMYGECGRGKSLLGRYVIPGLLMHHFKKAMPVFDTIEMNTRLDEILKMRLVSLDDIGTEDVIVNYGTRRQAFAEIMDNAEKRSVILIISTNLANKAQIEEKYGTRVYERIISTTQRGKIHR